MTIHSEHPFLPPEGDRNPVRRFRGRMPLPVTVWTAATSGRRAGWAVSSMLVADGDPAELLGLVDEESDLVEVMTAAETVAVSLLGWDQRALADAFAGAAPAPGGPFRLAQWSDTPWGPVLTGSSWLGARLVPEQASAGWALLVRSRIEQVEIGEAPPGGALAYLRGRYRALPD